jgi:DHA1 family multidrug resistance protein-like MFS transporter
MFAGLGVEWASSLLGFIAVALVPIPVLFYIFGPRIRAKSSFAAKVASASDEVPVENGKLPY